MRGALTALLLLVGLAGCSDEPPPSDPPCGQPLEICPLIGSGAQDFNGDGLAPEETALNLPSVARVTPDGGVCVMDFNNYRLRCLRDGVMETIAGSGVHAYATVEVDALSSPLENPIDFGYLPDGRVVFVSLHDPRVLRIEEDGLLVAIAGTGEVGDSGDGGPATEALFDELAGLVVGQDGTIYVSDDQAHRIRKITPDGIV
ncbi:MAG: hypothetical protein KC731_15675, partial [Myxococcales bacterium]|nr:hypothetical protein [Myxococcales bacterium]